MLRITWLSACLIFSARLVCAQQAVRIYAPGTLTAGLGYSRTERQSGTPWIQEPGYAFQLTGGIGMRYRNLVGAHLTAGLVLNTFSFIKSEASYVLASYTTTLQANLYGWIPLSRRHHSYLHIGVAGARMGYQDDMLESEEQGFRVMARSFGPPRYAIMPEAGVTKTFYRSHFALLLTYPLHTDRSDVISLRIIDPQGGLTASSRAEYMGVHMRFAWDLSGYRKKPAPQLPEPPDHREILSRTETRNQRFTTRARTATLYIADNGQEDQDSISVMLNGTYIITRNELRRKPSRIRLHLQEGVNTVMVVAHNTGQIPPNTASCELRTGFRRYRFGISTDLSRNEVIEIEVR